MVGPSVEIIIPFRDRGFDPRRHANLLRVLQHWNDSSWPVRICDDDRDGNAPFCRSAAYNRGVRWSPAVVEVFVFAESDMIIAYEQVQQAVELAYSSPGLVIPFTQYRYLNNNDSERVRSGRESAAFCAPESIMDNGTSVGAINVVSRTSMGMIGQWDEGFEGNWYDDRAMEHAFRTICGETRFVEGPAYHLFHLPGWQGSHITARDRSATAHNQERCNWYTQTSDPDRIRNLTAGGTL